MNKWTENVKKIYDCILNKMLKDINQQEQVGQQCNEEFYWYSAIEIQSLYDNNKALRKKIIFH